MKIEGYEVERCPGRGVYRCGHLTLLHRYTDMETAMVDMGIGVCHEHKKVYLRYFEPPFDPMTEQAIIASAIKHPEQHEAHPLVDA